MGKMPLHHMPKYPGTGNAVTRLLDLSYGHLQPFQIVVAGARKATHHY
jgi:hypothetical protein